VCIFFTGPRKRRAQRHVRARSGGQVTQQNAALVEEAAAAAQSLEDQAKSLNDALAIFSVSQ